ncbi:MAG: hypothetical protein D6746_01110 [Bacteroidetes bacterium]|nr:MAG: hypothetical protein D6746_01110 [Bacteroidota bacterium]
MDDVVSLFDEGPFVVLAQRSLAEAAYLGLCYDPSSPYVLSYPDVSERKSVLVAACGLDGTRRSAVTALTDGEVVHALVHLLMVLRKQDWALLVAYEELFWKVISGALFTDSEEIAMMRDRGKTISDWLVSRKKSLDAAADMLHGSIRPLVVDMTTGDSVAATAVIGMRDYTPEAVADVFGYGRAGEEGFYDEEE